MRKPLLALERGLCGGGPTTPQRHGDTVVDGGFGCCFAIHDGPTLVSAQGFGWTMSSQRGWCRLVAVVQEVPASDQPARQRYQQLDPSARLLTRHGLHQAPVVRLAQPVLIPALGFRLRSEEHTSELQSRQYLVCRLLLEKKKTKHTIKD